ncbi:MAG: snapalysin family zinc-dependent metalloprotease [Sciscionella sp.]
MSKPIRLLIALMALALPLAMMQLVAAPAATAAVSTHAAPTVLYYDASGAGEFQQVVNDAADIWNQSVHNVQLKPGTGSITVLADDGWPRTYPNGLGAGTVYMGREAVNEGYDPTRIAAHELGHILGLPDNRTGLCSDLMSGHSAPVSCTNAHPSQAEAAQVDANFANGAVGYSRTVTVYDGCFQPMRQPVHAV